MIGEGAAAIATADRAATAAARAATAQTTRTAAAAGTIATVEGVAATTEAVAAAAGAMTIEEAAVGAMVDLRAAAAADMEEEAGTAATATTRRGTRANWRDRELGGARGGATHLARIHGTEEDKVNCPFYFKIGACRHGDRCSRQHHKPPFSQTMIVQHMYQNPASQIAAAAGPVAARPEEGPGGVRRLLRGGLRRARRLRRDRGAQRLREPGRPHGRQRLLQVRRRGALGRGAQGALRPLLRGPAARLRVLARDGLPRGALPPVRRGGVYQGGYCNFMHIRTPSRSLRKDPRSAKKKWRKAREKRERQERGESVVERRRRVARPPRSRAAPRQGQGEGPPRAARATRARRKRQNEPPRNSARVRQTASAAVPRERAPQARFEPCTRRESRVPSVRPGVAGEQLAALRAVAVDALFLLVFTIVLRVLVRNY